MAVATKCPLCGKPSAEKVNPFCSQHCAMLDLGRWLGEGYKIETAERDDEADSLPDLGGEEENR